MGKIIIKNAVQRRQGYIYYIDGQGNICEAVSAVGRGRKKKKTKKTVKKTVKKIRKVKKPTTKKKIVKKKKKKK